MRINLTTSWRADSEPGNSGTRNEVLSGRNGPARPTAAGRSRPSRSLPSFAGPTRQTGRDRVQSVTDATKLVFVSPLYTVMCRYICGSPPTDCTRPPHKRDGHTASSAFFSQRNSTRSCPCFSAPRCKQRSTVPQGYTWVPPSQPPLRGGCGASRRERFALPWYPALRVLPGCVPVFLHGRRPLAGRPRQFIRFSR